MHIWIMQSAKSHSLQSGAVLIVGLVMLVVVTLLATASTRTAISELLIARNHQIHERAFHAAEAGIERILAATTFYTGAPISSTEVIDAVTTVDMQVVYAGQTSVPEEIFRTVTASGLSAYHFIGTATATVGTDSGSGSTYDVRTVHSQSFYLVGPASTVLSPTIAIPDSSESLICVGTECIETSFDPSPIRTAWRTGGIE